MIVGIDLNSRSVAMCLLRQSRDQPRPSWQKFTVPARITDRAVILGQLYGFVTHRIYPEDIVFVESPVLAGVRNVQSTIKVAAAYGSVLAAINATHAVTHEVAVSSWKVATHGKGNASKSDVADWLHTQHPDHHRECGTDQDLIDATCIALYGVQLTERSSDAGARERRLLHQAT